MAKAADDRAWSDFVAWCSRRGLRAMPAHPWTLAAYVRWCETRQPYSSVMRRVKAIGLRHVLAGLPALDRHPLVQRTLRLVERREPLRDRRAALFPDPDAAAETAARKAARFRKSGRTVGLAAAPKLVSRRPRRG